MSRIKSLPNRLQSVPQRTAVAVGSWRAGTDSREARGYDYRWRKYRAGFLHANPLCVMCKARGLVTVATIVDHIVPHQGDQARFWDATNHQALCAPCHNRDKAREEREAGLRGG
jgi:5-methylcytosine-specific restriction endonuclease McrA